MLSYSKSLHIILGYKRAKWRASECTDIFVFAKWQSALSYVYKQQL